MQNRGECLSATEANQNFSKADDEAMRLLVDFDYNLAIEMTDDEKIDFVARRVLNRYRASFEEPAK